MLFDHLNKFSKKTALISENLEKLSHSELISRADKIGSQVTKKITSFHPMRKQYRGAVNT